MNAETAKHDLLPNEQAETLKSAYHAYCQQISRHKVLTIDEEVTLFEKIENGDPVAKQLFIESNLRLVVARARRFAARMLHCTDEMLLELIQEGNLGLLKAVDKFNPRAGCRFNTYAIFWIDASIRAAVLRLSTAVELPPSYWDLLQKIRRTMGELRDRFGREPLPAEIAGALNEPVERVERLLPCLYPAISFQDVPNTNRDDDREFEAFYQAYDTDPETAQVEDSIIAEETRTALDEILRSLFNDRQRYLFCSRWGICGFSQKSAAELAETLGISTQTVYADEKRYLAQLTQYLLSQNKTLSDFI